MFITVDVDVLCFLDALALQVVRNLPFVVESKLTVLQNLKSLARALTLQFELDEITFVLNNK